MRFKKWLWILILLIAVILLGGEVNKRIRWSRHMVSNCGNDENGGFTGGQPGDQTGEEWCIRAWDKRPWTCVLRYPDEKVRNEFAELAKASAENNLIGYNQNKRDTFWEHLKASGYDPANITVACDADCSAGVAAIIKAVGYREHNDTLKNTELGLTTSEMRKALEKEGFVILTDRKYLDSPDYLFSGDILLYEKHHVIINITDGSRIGRDSGR